MCSKAFLALFWFPLLIFNEYKIGGIVYALELKNKQLFTLHNHLAVDRLYPLENQPYCPNRRYGDYAMVLIDKEIEVDGSIVLSKAHAGWNGGTG